MSELVIDPSLGAPIECEVGDILTLTVVGNVISKNPDGGKTLTITEVQSYDDTTDELQEEIPVEGTAAPSRAPSIPGAAAALLAKRGKI